MQAGRLRNRITIQSLQSGQDEIGQPVTTWTDVVNLSADIGNTSGSEMIKANAETSIVKSSIMIRPYPGITSAMRAVDRDDGTIYEIKAVIPDKRKKDRTYLVCEVVNA